MKIIIAMEPGPLTRHFGPPSPIRWAGAYDWAFTSPAWAAAEFQTVVLEKVRRQDEPRFAELLGNFRRGRCVGEDARMLHGRVRHFPPASLTRLLTHNLQVDKWNNFQLGELPGGPVVLPAAEEGPELPREFRKKNLLTPANLVLQRGARVMFTINRTERGQRQPLFVNGQTGVVVDCGVRNAE